MKSSLFDISCDLQSTNLMSYAPPSLQQTSLQSQPNKIDHILSISGLFPVEK